MKTYNIYVWKYLNDNTRQLIDIVANVSQNALKRILKATNNLYDFWNYEVEYKEV